MKKYLELAKKVKALAEQGSEGERQNAQKLLDQLMQKYKISTEELEIELVKNFEFTVKIKQLWLWRQIVFSVGGRELINTLRVHRRFFTKRYLKCTTSQKIEIEMRFSFYWKAYQEEEKIFHHAFVQKNNIYPENETDKTPPSELTEKELHDLDRMFKMANGIQRKSIIKQLK